MAQTVKVKRSAVAGKVPLVGDLALGELAVNTFDGKLFLKKNDGTDAIIEFSTTDHLHVGVYEPVDATILKGADIGVNVQAYDVDIPTVVASQAEAEAGTSTANRTFTPQRVAQAITALGGGGVGWAGSYPAVAADLAANAVAQSELKTTTGVVSTTSKPGVMLTLAGGAYGFYPQSKYSGQSALHRAQMTDGVVSTSYATKIFLSAPSAFSTTVYSRQMYVQASPPYDLGNGEVPTFILLLVDKVTGDIVSSYVAQDPPWANNGPTNCHADFYDENKRGFVMKVVCPFTKAQAMKDPVKMQANLDAIKTGPVPVEVTQAMKQADMPLIPHPFSVKANPTADDLAGGVLDSSKYEVVMLDPNDKFTIDAFNMSEAFSDGAGEVADLIHESGFFKLSSTPVAGMITPSGVIGVRGRLI